MQTELLKRIYCEYIKQNKANQAYAVLESIQYGETYEAMTTDYTSKTFTV